MVLRGVVQQIWDPTGMESSPPERLGRGSQMSHAAKGFHAVSGAMDTASPCLHWTNRATSEYASQAPHHCHRLFCPFNSGQSVPLHSPPTSIHSPILETIISSVLATSLNQTLKTGDLRSKALASSQI